MKNADAFVLTHHFSSKTMEVSDDSCLKTAYEERLLDGGKIFRLMVNPKLQEGEDQQAKSEEKGGSMTNERLDEQS